MVHLINFAVESCVNLTHAGLQVTGALIKCANSVSNTLVQLFLG